MKKNIRRKPGKLIPKPRIVVYVEGETEKEYLEAYRAMLRIDKDLVDVRYPNETDAKYLASLARRVKKREEKEHKSLIMQDDQWWVLADTEGKKIPSDAKDIADSSGIFLALSNPSIETWLLLHYEYCKNYGLNVDQVTQKLKKYLPRYAKHPDMNALLPRVATACDNAQKLRKIACNESEDLLRTDCDILLKQVTNLAPNVETQKVDKDSVRSALFAHNGK